MPLPPPPPGGPPGGATVPPGPPDAIDEFVKVNGVDPRAASMLKALPKECQDSILADGPVSGTNPSAVLTARIRKLEPRAAELRKAVAGTATQAPPGPPPGPPPALGPPGPPPGPPGPP